MIGPHTASQTSGPMFGFALMFEGSEQAIDPADPGATSVFGAITDGDGPMRYPDGLLEIWQGDQWVRTRPDENGDFAFTVRKPEPVSGPDGVTFGPHLNVALFGRGLLKHVYTRMYFPDELQANALDPLLDRVPAERRHTLIAKVEGDRLRFDIHLQGDDETVFFEI